MDPIENIYNVKEKKGHGWKDEATRFGLGEKKSTSLDTHADLSAAHSPPMTQSCCRAHNPSRSPVVLGPLPFRATTTPSPFFTPA